MKKHKCPNCEAELNWKKMIFAISRYRCESCNAPLRLAIAPALGAAVVGGFIFSFGKMFIPNGIANCLALLIAALTIIFAPREVIRD